MTTPVNERDDPMSRAQTHTDGPSHHPHRSGDDEGTVVGDGSVRHNSPPRPFTGKSHLAVRTDGHAMDDIRSLQSPSRTREEAHRLEDDLALLKAERMVSAEADAKQALGHSKSVHRSKSRRDEPPDDFDLDTTPTHENSVYKPPENPNTSIGKIFKKIHNSFWLIRYFLYIIPVSCIFLIPLLLGIFVFPNASVGGVRLMWFSIWLEIVWLSLWAGRVSLAIDRLELPLIPVDPRQVPAMAHWGYCQHLHQQF